MKQIQKIFYNTGSYYIWLSNRTANAIYQFDNNYISIERRINNKRFGIHIKIYYLKLL